MDNVYTLGGVHGHRRADRPVEESLDGVRTAHSVWLRSMRLGLVGKADIVEFRSNPAGGESVYPVEYKHGRRRRWDNDDVQLCAQALCLEEMLGVAVPAGAVYHIKSKRRREIAMSPDLRAKTEAAARRLHELIASGMTPPPVLKPRCRGCSLNELCMPGLLSETWRVEKYARGLFTISPEEGTVVR